MGPTTRSKQKSLGRQSSDADVRFHPLRTLAAHGSMQAMRLNSISANRYFFDGQVYGKPLRLLLRFDGDRALRLQVAEDGERMIADAGPLDAPFDMDGYGQTDIADVTESLFPTLQGVEVTDVQALAWTDRRVGVKLNVAGGEPFHFGSMVTNSTGVMRRHSSAMTG